MGKDAYFRIHNKSKVDVTVSIEDCDRVHSDGVGNLTGELAVGAQFPAEGGEDPFGLGLSYQRIEGEPTRRIHRDGHFNMVVTTSNDKKENVLFTVDRSTWMATHAHHAEHHELKVDDGIAISTAIDEDEGQPMRIEVRIYDAIPTASWMNHMKDVIADKPLCQVSMPGTHDSATYKWNKELGASPDSDLTTSIQEKLDRGPGVIGKIGSKITDGILKLVFERMCQCQDMTISEQLRAGIRYLDLRVAYHQETDAFYSCHGVYCAEMDDVLDQIVSFLQEHDQEIVILDFNHFYGMSPENHEAFSKQVLAKFEGLSVSRNELGPESTVAEYLEKGARAVIVYHDKASYQASEGMLWYRNVIDSPWPNKNKTEELKPNLEEKVQNRNPNKFFVLQGILTPDGELIKEEILESKGETSIKSIASRVSGKVVDWVGDEWKEANHNIVIVDFFQDCSMVPAILNLNQPAA